MRPNMTLAVLAALFLTPATASATVFSCPVQDEGQASADGGDYVGVGHPLAQTFKAGYTGHLSQVNVNVIRNGDAVEPLVVALHSTVGGVPTSTVVAGPVVVTPASVPGAAAGWIQVPGFSLDVTVGTVYAIVLGSAATSGLDYSWSTYSASDLYADGGRFWDNSGTWTPVAGSDHAFLTYVDCRTCNFDGDAWCTEKSDLCVETGCRTGGTYDVTDCDDDDIDVYPGATELCNGVDDNCVDGVDELNPGGGAACASGEPGVCSDGTKNCEGGKIVCTPDIEPGTQVEACNALDDDCNGSLPANEVDNDGDGKTECAAGAANDACDDDRNAWTAAACAACSDPEGDSWWSGCDTYATVQGPDNCPNAVNPTQGDTDTDGAGDACDLTPGPLAANSELHAPATVSINPDGSGSQGVVVVRLVDPSGAVQPGYEVFVTEASGTAYVIYPAATPGKAVTDANGEAIVYVADTAAETVVFTARWANGAGGWHELTAPVQFVAAGTASTVSVPSSEGTWTVLAPGATLLDAYVYDADQLPSGLPASAAAPYGFAAIALAVPNPGDTALVLVELPGPFTAGMKLFKYLPLLGWQDVTLDNHVLFTVGSTSYQISLKDGEWGDADGVANGIILDPSGPVMLPFDCDPDGDSKCTVYDDFCTQTECDPDTVVKWDLDNCPAKSNPLQTNGDADAFGDACDCDLDGDGACFDTAAFACADACAGQTEDCDDADADVNPGETEICNDLDDNCNAGPTTVDEGCDDDVDGWCDASMTVAATQPAVCPNGNGDCNDADGAIRPNATETTSNDVDENCDGNLSCWVDADNDGFGTAATTTVTLPATCTSSATASTTGGGSSGPANATFDCNDGSTAVKPGATETNSNDIDEDCDSTLLCWVDADNDGFGTATTTTVTLPTTCTGSATASTTGGGSSGPGNATFDCNDGSTAVKPGATETNSNDVDEDCDSTLLCWVDADNDGFGTAATATVTLPTTCTSSTTTSATGGGATGAGNTTFDCNDGDDVIRPNATETNSNDVDENCDSTLLCWVDADNDGFGTASTANVALPATCTSSTTASTTGGGSSGPANATFDCNDGSAAVKPGATETNSNDVDENCDSTLLCWVDADNDSFGTATTTTVTLPATCTSSTIASATGGGSSGAGNATFDCNDGSAAVKPGATELAGDSVDQNCDGAETCYTDADDDGYRPNGTSTVASTDTDCTDPYEATSSDPTGDCLDTNPAVKPVESINELCNGLDDDCDGAIDDDDTPDLDGNGFFLSGDTVNCENQVGVCNGAKKPASLCAAVAGSGTATWSTCANAQYETHDATFDLNELCDDLDNDCDGFKDAADIAGGDKNDVDANGYFVSGATADCEVLQGVCAGAHKRAALCVNGVWGACATADYEFNDAEYEAGTEVSCDGLDNDCNSSAAGSVDEDFTVTLPHGGSYTGIGKACGVGACAGGVTVCKANETAIVCDKAPGGNTNAATPERCNNLDDDCDGFTDKADTSSVNAQGFFFDPATGTVSDAPDCGNQQGVCSGSKKRAALCTTGTWGACANGDYAFHSAAFEIGTETKCDGLDNDCNSGAAGSVDEDFSVTLLDGATVLFGLDKPCGFGVCVGGQTECNLAGNDVVCSTEALATTEKCDGSSVDEDCDDVSDDGFTHTDGDEIGDECDPDDDNDGDLDVADNCRVVVNPDQQNSDGDAFGDLCDPDDDNDGLLDDGNGSGTIGDAKCTGGLKVNCDDNCQVVSNATQLDFDSDAIGDACDLDDDDDGVNEDGNNNGSTTDKPCVAGATTNCDDNCPLLENDTQANNDADAQGDACDADDDNDTVLDGPDNCDFVANASQSDSDGNGVGDACDGDVDGDGDPNATDCAPNVAAVYHGATELCNGVDDNCSGVTDEGFLNTDSTDLADCVDTDDDNDGVPDTTDNCPLVVNAPQTNTDLALFQGGNTLVTADALGDACDLDDDGDGDPDAADCSLLNPAIRHGAIETCNAIDDNCTAGVDEGFTNTDGTDLADCVDTDDDNDGDPDGTDCAPLNGAVRHGATETCNDVDDNCSGVVDEGFVNTDGDTKADCVDGDDDNDGALDAADNCPLVANVDQLDTDVDLQGDACDADDDDDGVLDSAPDNCRLDWNDDQANSDNDTKGDACDTDDDNDGVLDSAPDNCRVVANPSQADADTDGVGDACDNDTDGDGVGDDIDNCKTVKNAGQQNNDGDAQGDACDLDDDNDTLPDTSDNCPFASNQDQTNTDLSREVAAGATTPGVDILGDVCDPDDDGDALLDATDNCPLVHNPDQTNTDQALFSGGNGDAVPDAQGDACDADDDGDGKDDVVDNCRTDWNADQKNTDADARGDVCDLDDDDDGDPDLDDNCPLVANADQVNTDLALWTAGDLSIVKDGLGDACDTDDDGDARLDAADNCPLVPNATQVNTDSDTLGDACDADDDNDGVADDGDGSGAIGDHPCLNGQTTACDDNCRLVGNADQLNTDQALFDGGNLSVAKDANGDACDTDDDGDVVADTLDNCPKVANADQVDTDGNGTGDACSNDLDGDGWVNDIDNCPEIANVDQTNTDLDLQGNACDDDDDNDGIADDGDGSGVIGDGRCTGDQTLGCDDNCVLASNGEQLDTDGDRAGNACDDDDDGDAKLDIVDNCQLVPNFDQRDTDGDLAGDACDTDDDNDAVADDGDGSGAIGDHPCTGGAAVACDDNCRLDKNTTQRDNESDGIGDACDDDDDNDTVLDANDNCPTIANLAQSDNEADGSGDVCDLDDDNDGKADGTDNCPVTANADQADTDHDDFGNACDTDDDNDAMPDAGDNCPLVSNADQVDTDGDLTGDLCDNDDDNDTVVDGSDNCPLVANTTQTDNDLDATGDACDLDDDNDGIVDTSDNCRTIANVDQKNNDGDGLGDACDLDDDEDTIADNEDNCPFVSNKSQKDTDGDEEGDACDLDDDDDGIPDDDGDGLADPCTNNVVAGCDDNCRVIANTNQKDTDGDLLGNVCDLDDDNDGIADDGNGTGVIGDAPCASGVTESCDDNCPLDANDGQLNTDGDTKGDACDPDDDNDGVLDDGNASGVAGDFPCTAGANKNCDDNCPLDGNKDQLDTEKDGVGNVCDDDDDNDSVFDEADNCVFVANDTQSDTDHDGIGDACEDDTDNDGWPDALDNCQFVVNPDQENTDESLFYQGVSNITPDGLGDVCDDDDDGDDDDDSTDCAPLDPASHHGADELCNGVDDDCDGPVDEGFENTDGDLHADCVDLDDDDDAVPDDADNCRLVQNADQVNTDGDGLGDPCDDDDDGDGISDDGDGSGVIGDSRCTDGETALCDDNCRLDANASQLDTDGDAEGDPCDLDDDDDGEIDPLDNCPLLANDDQADNEADGFGDLCDPDDDNDGVFDDGDGSGVIGDGKCAGGQTSTCDDNCAFTANSNQTDTDADRLGNVCDLDDDGDGVPDANDNCALVGNSTQQNTDGDELGDACDPDDDNDNIPDAFDNCQLVFNILQTNTDGDAFGDSCDPDDDNDEIDDGGDNCPAMYNPDQQNTDLALDEANWPGIEGDLDGDACDADDDNDAVADAEDNCQVTPNDKQQDNDDDGYGDLCDADDDNDGVPDDGDDSGTIGDAKCPDGVVEGCDDNCVFNANADQSDNDEDFFGDACDELTDYDGDSKADSNDNCPYVYNKNQANNDLADEDVEGAVMGSDIIGDACDLDDDNDEVLDDGSNNGKVGDDVCVGGSIVDCDDNCQFISNPDQENNDGDNLGDVCDDDDDDDGILDDGDGSDDVGDKPCTGGKKKDCDDNCLFDPNADQADNDADGVGDVCDDDDDNDGVPDDGDGTGVPGDNPCIAGELTGCDDNCAMQTNPTQANNDGDASGDACDADDDNDGVPDDGDASGVAGDNPCPNAQGTNTACDDNCVHVANNGQSDLDADGLGDLCDKDQDGDGVLEDGDGSKVAGDGPCVGGDVVACDDNCPEAFNPDQQDADADGKGDLCDTLVDSDGDGIANGQDNCLLVANADQADYENDGHGDVCDDDDDDDGVADDGDLSDAIGDAPCKGGARVGCDDNCYGVPNTDQADNDSDGVGDVCDADDDNDEVPDDSDNCPFVANADQANLDATLAADKVTDATTGKVTVGDGQGDACDNDWDNDSVGNDKDNCDHVPNFRQTDLDDDGLGDSCDDDIDGDDVTNADETKAGTSPTDADSDDDGVDDGVELQSGTNPLSAEDYPDHRRTDDTQLVGGPSCSTASPVSGGSPFATLALLALVGGLVLARRRRVLPIAALLIVAAFAPTAHAEGFNFQWYHPVGLQNGTLVTETSYTVPTKDVIVALDYMFANDVARISNLGASQAFVGRMQVLEFLVGVGLFPNSELNLHLPLVVDRTSSAGTGLSSHGVADMEISLKYAFLSGSRDAIGVAIVPFLTVPTGAQDQFLGWGSVTGGAMVAVDRKVGPVFLAGNVGFNFRPERRFHPAMNAKAASLALFGLSAEWRVIERWLSVLGEAKGGVDVGGNDNATQLEALTGLRVRVGGFQIITGGAFGVLDGAGTPDYRFMARFGYDVGIGGGQTKDSDSDGIVDVDDRCPAQPEDFDGFMDWDGCPERDNDSDGLEDGADQCPAQAEDLDGFNDTDGCPDLDNDGDGVRDNYDACPDQPETVNQYRDDDGCPDEVPAGAPVAPAGHPKYVFTETTSLVFSNIEFQTGAAVLLDKSKTILDDIASSLKQYPGIRVRIEGHTDTQGDPGENLLLSQQRALTVLGYLVDKGVPSATFEFAGYGQTRPIADNKTEDGKAKNRRVEFHVTDFRGVMQPADDAK